MRFLAKKSTLFILYILVGFSSPAQLKELGDDQYFKSNFNGIIQPLPVVTRWIDDEHFILLRDGTRYTVNARTGTEKPYSDTMNRLETGTPIAYNKEGDIYVKINGREIQLTTDKEKKSNPTVSPDGNYVAYTKSYDLYTININSKKENRLTTDGSDVILNGYASWLYMEEILGRSTQYRAFWWSPDSKKLILAMKDPKDTAKNKPPKPYLINKFRFKQDVSGYQYDTSRTHVYLFDIATKKTRQITAGIYSEADPTWSPDAT
ncbi:MAG: DPP IV N-terminal domain-containing protein, partial [Ferruginibacter sp.]